MLFYYSDNQTIYYFRESKTAEQIWWDHSRVMNDFEFMNEMNQFIDYIEKFNPQNIILNMEKMFHHVRPDFIPYIIKKFNEVRKSQVKKVAIIDSNDSKNRELMRELAQKTKFEPCLVETFDNEEKAINWLKEPKDEQYANKIFKVA